jgi:hypothetical protein
VPDCAKLTTGRREKRNRAGNVRRMRVIAASPLFPTQYVEMFGV